MISCTRRIQFCAGHRVAGHENKCAHLHGHNYVALIEARSEELDSVGRVIDFGVLKEKLGGWIDREWDHGLILWSADGDMIELARDPRCGPCDQPQKLYLLPYNPTAENLARYLLSSIAPDLFLGTGVIVSRVTIWETENCFAVAER